MGHQCKYLTWNSILPITDFSKYLNRHIVKSLYILRKLLFYEILGWKNKPRFVTFKITHQTKGNSCICNSKTITFAFLEITEYAFTIRQPQITDPGETFC